MENEHYHPQEETRNALALFVGYRCWDDFVLAQQPAVVPAGNGQPEAEPAKSTPGSGIRVPAAPFARGGIFLKKARLLLLVAGCLTGLSAWLGWRRTAEVPLSGKYLTGRPPLTPIFTYDLSHTAADSLHLYLDVPDTVIPLRREGKAVSAWYQIPGYFKVQVRAGRKPLSAVLPVHVLSDGWEAGVSKERERNPSRFGRLPYQGRLFLPRAQAVAWQVDTTREYWTEWRNVRDFGAGADDFTLETRVKNDPAEGGIRCHDVLLRVFGQYDDLRLQFVQPGCFRWVNVQAAEVRKSGETEDLSAFGQEVRRWATLKVRVKDRLVQVFFNGKLISELAYRQPLGPIKGISYKFFGSGSVDYLRVYDQSGRRVYSEDF